MGKLSDKAYINEADVELKVMYPILTNSGILNLDALWVRPKEYLAPTVLDKQAGKKSGYYPDFSVWMQGNPVLVIEVKDTDVTVDVGYREALLYARHLNARYPTGRNPCRFSLATNGIELLAGVWDQEWPLLRLKVEDLQPGTVATGQLEALMGRAALEAHAARIYAELRIERGLRPFNLAGGQALLAAKTPLNSFAAGLSPILRRYFSSVGEEDVSEIIKRAYVSSAEATEYDRVLEALLKDRASPRRDTPVQPLQPGKNDEPQLSTALRSFSASGTRTGQLQIIQGGVGSGKSLFARRYREVLEPEDLKAINHWAFIDYNNSPTSLRGAEDWLCRDFIESFQRENPGLDIYDSTVQRGIFSRKIQQRRSYYEQMRSISASEEIRARAKDIVKWQDDPFASSEGLAEYINGVTGKSLIVVMDNVDKLDLDNQLDAFQLSLWFMHRSKSFIILQMRDETYERYKNKPPLDTFRSGIAFHISPPRFIDVVKRRLELGLEYLADHNVDHSEYVLDNSIRVKVPKGEIGAFLTSLYGALFGRRTNIARLLEALAGRDVRRALEMFVSLVTSGHLSTSAITSTVRGAGEFQIPEHTVIKILMRTDYRFFSEDNNTGFISNVFYYSNDWIIPDNFLVIEILYFLIMNRKTNGEIGLEGYFSVRRIQDEIGKLGYASEDIHAAINHLLSRQLIIAENFNFSAVSRDQSVKVLASGFMHLRILCSRIEYIYGVIPSVPISDRATAARLATYVNAESQRAPSSRQKAEAVKCLVDFLDDELQRTRVHNPFFDSSRSGASYVVNAIQNSLHRYYNQRPTSENEDQLDLL